MPEVAHKSQSPVCSIQEGGQGLRHLLVGNGKVTPPAPATASEPALRRASIY